MEAAARGAREGPGKLAEFTAPRPAWMRETAPPPRAKTKTPTPRDRAKAAILADPEASNQAIAEAVGCSVDSARAARAILRTRGELPDEHEAAA